MTYHACVWIDHREAKIFSITPEDADKETLEERGPAHHIHQKADHVGHGTEPLSKDFLSEIAASLDSAKAILIAGPGKARTELAGYLNEHFPALAKRVWGVEAMDHPTDGQLIAAARKYFKAADRMH